MLHMHSPSGSKFVDYYGVEFEFYDLLHQTFFHPKSISIAYIHFKIKIAHSLDTVKFMISRKLIGCFLRD